MVPWKELRELIVLYYDMKVLNDAEFLLLYDLYSPQNLDLPCDLYPHFDLQNLTEDECVAEFRFRKTDIPRLSQALRIPDVIICHQGTICEGTEGLCMLLKRLCYPCRYSDMVHLFARPVPVLCMITNQVLDYIYQAHSHRILQWNHQQLSQANLERFAEVVHRKGAPLNNCFAFVDGTVRPICRPGTVNQRLLYNGHKRVHGIKFQSVVTPDGMIANMYGPVGKLFFFFKIMESEVYRVRRQLLNCTFFSFHLEKSLEMKLLGNIQLLFYEKLKKETLTNQNTSLSLPHSQADYVVINISMDK